MKDPNDMSGDERYTELNDLGPEVYGKRWKSQFAAQYGIGKTTVSLWRHKGAPVWAIVALRSEVSARRTQQALRNLATLTVGPIAPPA